jgi:site-specific DNA recombinase
MLVEYCERQGWAYTIYEDAGISGETIEARPQMQRLLTDALDRKFDVALAVEIERFSRSRDGADLAVIKRTFRAGGVRFGTPAQLYDPDDVEDDFVSSLLGLLSAREKQKTVRRTTHGREEAARAGRYVANTPYGYRRAPGGGALVIHEPDAAVVRMMFEQLLAGASLRAIIRELNRRAVPTAKGAGRWTHGTVWKILKNPVYGGTAYYRKQRIERLAGGARRLRSRDRTEQIAMPAPQIVDPAQVIAVQQRFAENLRRSRRSTKRFYLLRGLVRCGVCGHTMIGKSVGRGVAYYTCAASDSHDRGIKPRCRWHAANAHRLEAMVWEQVRLALQFPEVILEEVRQYRDARFGERDELQARLAAVRAALERLPAERDRVQTLFREGCATTDEVRGHLDRIERKRQGLEDELRTIAVRLEGELADEQRGRELIRTVERTRGGLDGLSDQERHEVARVIVVSVIVGADQTVEIQGWLPTSVSSAHGQPDNVVYRQTVWQPMSESGEALSVASPTW